MRRELLETQRDTLFPFVEVQNNNIQLLIQLHNFFRMRNPAPAKVSNMHQPIDTAEVDKHPV